MSRRADHIMNRDERLPWLETVEERDAAPRRGRGWRYALFGLLLLGAAGGMLYWQRIHQGQNGNGALIEAPPGDYKVKPDEPGGMKVGGEGDTVFSTSQGAVSNAGINVAALPEAPVEARPAPKTPPKPAGASRSATLPLPPAVSADDGAPPAGRASVQPAVPALADGAGALVQLGAFPSEGAANIAWAQLSKRFGYLAPLGKSIERFVKPDGKTVYRLRVNAGSNGQAREICGKLKVAGEGCFVTN